MAPTLRRCLTLDPIRANARRGFKTGMLVSGDRRSLVGTFDAALLRQHKPLQKNIDFRGRQGGFS